MKRTKKFAAIALAATMTLGAAMPALAAENYTITIGNSKTGNVKTEEHTMKAYQIFAGDVEGNELTNISWGNGFNPENLIAALKADTTIGAKFEGITYAADKPAQSAAAVAKALDGFTADQTKALNAILAAQAVTAKADNNGTNKITIPGTDAGYYFIKDESAITDKGSDAYSDYILQVLGDVDINIKTDAPSIEKKIMEGNTLVDTNSASIGETVIYQIKSVVPDTKDYDTFYYYYMKDTFSAGLTFDDIYNVWIDQNNDTVMDSNEVLTLGTDYAVYEEGQTVTIAFLDMLAKGKNGDLVGKNVYVNYGAVLNSSAVVGIDGNPNKVDLSYSNNPTVDYDFDKSGDKDKPGLPKNEEDSKYPIGETPEDTVITYTTEVKLTKYADTAKEGYELEGAEFTLTGTAHKTIYKTADVYTEAENGNYWLLKDGTYTTTAPVVDEIKTMVAADADATEGYVLVTDEADYAETDVVLDGKHYRVAAEGETVEYTLHTTLTNDDLYANVNVKYTKTEATETQDITYNVKRVFTTGADGIIVFEGLDAGTYEIEETVVPDGYNKCDNITFTLTWSGAKEVEMGNEQCTWNEKEEKLNVNLGKFSINVINLSGATLPTTGGVGTTMFYVFGSMLAVVGGVALISRRRMAR